MILQASAFLEHISPTMDDSAINFTLTQGHFYGRKQPMANIC